MDWNTYQLLYDVERSKHIRLVHKLTDAHLNPNNFQRMNVGMACAVLSNHMAIAIKMYREMDAKTDEEKRIKSLFKGIFVLTYFAFYKTIQYLFIGTEHIERLTKLINDTFDVLNGRFLREGITVLNWHDKKRKLDNMLESIAATERWYAQSKKPRKMFASTTTLRGWRISILSTIALVEQQFNANYKVALTGKLNQDALEVRYCHCLARRSFCNIIFKCFIAEIIWNHSVCR